MQKLLPNSISTKITYIRVLIYKGPSNWHPWAAFINTKETIFEHLVERWRLSNGNFKRFKMLQRHMQLDPKKPTYWSERSMHSISRDMKNIVNYWNCKQKPIESCKFVQAQMFALFFFFIRKLQVRSSFNFSPNSLQKQVQTDLIPTTLRNSTKLLPYKIRKSPNLVPISP